MRIYSLSSGSKGNATLIVCGDLKILIDIGISKKYLQSCLNELNYSIEDIDILLITHFHSDHVKGLKSIDNNKIYSLNKEHQELNINKVNYFNDVIIKPFILSHDDQCLGYQIKYQDLVYTHISDTGYVKNEYYQLIRESDFLYLEFNHDISMLKQCQRPAHVKKRILSDVGHLNNDSAAYLLSKTSDNLKQVFIAHISDEANDISLINKSIEQVISDFDIKMNFELLYTGYHKVISGGFHED